MSDTANTANTANNHPRAEELIAKPTLIIRFRIDVDTWRDLRIAMRSLCEQYNYGLYLKFSAPERTATGGWAVDALFDERPASEPEPGSKNVAPIQFGRGFQPGQHVRSVFSVFNDGEFVAWPYEVGTLLEPAVGREIDSWRVQYRGGIGLALTRDLQRVPQLTQPSELSRKSGSS